MQSLLRNICRAGSRGTSLKPMGCIILEVTALPANLGLPQRLLGSSLSGTQTDMSTCSYNQSPSKLMKPDCWAYTIMNGVLSSGFGAKTLAIRCLSTMENANVSVEEETPSSPAIKHPPRIKFKRLDKTARHIMNILNKEAVEKVCAEREIPDVQPGCIVQMRVQVPENKRRESTLKGIVIARHNAGINTTFRLRRLVAGVGVESVFPLYSPNIKDIKILDRKKVRRAKLYYLRDRMNPLKK